MAVEQFNLPEGQRADRKSLITVVEWHTSTPEDVYILQSSEPNDWSSNYTSYYTKSGSTYSAVSGGTAPIWTANTYYTKSTSSTFREILGTRTEDSSIEFNADVETTTDIRGNNFTDMNKTQPQQSFDPFLVLGGSKLGALLHDIMFRNAVSELNQFTVYVIASYIGDSSSGYKAQKQEQCTITFDSLGGDANVNFPITVYFSNKITTGSVDKLADDFVFTPDLSV